MTPYYPDYPARDGHPYMFALEGNAGTVKKLQAHPDPKADEPRSASRTARNGYRATKQNLHDLVLKTPDPRTRPPTTRCRTTSDGLPALAQRQVTTHPPRGASPPSPAGGMSADLTGSSTKMDIGPTFSRRSFALGFVVVLAFPVAPVFAGREHRASREDAAKGGFPCRRASARCSTRHAQRCRHRD
jgi:hypothetical protein